MACSSIFIHPGTGTSVGTGAGQNSLPTKWPHQPETLQAFPPSLSTPQPLSLGSVAGLSHRLQTQRVPPCSAPALALVQLSWAWTTLLPWLGPAHPSLPPTPVPQGDARVPTQGHRGRGGKRSSPLLPASPEGGLCRAPMGRGAAPSGCTLPPTRAPSPSTPQGPGGAVNHCQTRVHSWAL